MPSQILHVLFGQDLLHTADMHSELLSSSLFPYYALGCQGPDIFYHSQRLRPVGLEYGTLMHRRGFGSTAAKLLSLSAPLYPGKEAAYALGFCTHAFLDRALHPYIVYKAGWVAPDRPETERYARCHAFFERIIDVLMLRILRGEAIESWNQQSLLSDSCQKMDEHMQRLLAQALLYAYPKRTTGDKKLTQRIANAYTDAGFFYALSDPRRTTGHGQRVLEDNNTRRPTSLSSLALVYPEALPLDIDYLNLLHEPWRHPYEYGAKDDRSVPDVYAAARNDFSPVFCSIYEALHKNALSVKDTETLLGNGGLSITDKNGSPCRPYWSDPFALDEVLEQQHERRFRYSCSSQVTERLLLGSVSIES